VDEAVSATRGERGAAAGSELGSVKRVVLKLSGESLAGDGGYGIDPERRREHLPRLAGG
jgi:hypothetical protein